jgi:hypothetical protein
MQAIAKRNPAAMSAWTKRKASAAGDSDLHALM